MFVNKTKGLGRSRDVGSDTCMARRPFWTRKRQVYVLLPFSRRPFILTTPYTVAYNVTKIRPCHNGFSIKDTHPSCLETKELARCLQNSSPTKKTSSDMQDRPSGRMRLRIDRPHSPTPVSPQRKRTRHSWQARKTSLIHLTSEKETRMKKDAPNTIASDRPVFIFLRLYLLFTGKMDSLQRQLVQLLALTQSDPRTAPTVYVSLDFRVSKPAVHNTPICKGQRLISEPHVCYFM